MKIKTIKFIAPLACLSTAASMVPVVTSCSSASYSVSINASNRFYIQGEKIGKNKATNGKLYQIKIQPVSNFKIERSDIEVKIGGIVETNWVYQENILSITGQFITGDIEITITPTVINLFEVDEISHQLKGFTEGLTKEEIAHACKGTLTIPMNVVTIAENAFYDGENSTIPSSVTNLVFDEHTDLKQDESEKFTILTGFSRLQDQPDSYGIGKQAFKCSPFKHIKLPVAQGYTIAEQAFADSTNLEVLELPEPDKVTEEEAEMKKYGDDGYSTPGYWKILKYVWDTGLWTKANFINKHTVTLESKCFYNTKNLKYVSFTLLSKINSTDCFKIIGDDGNEAPSNANVLDFSNYGIAQVCQNSKFSEGIKQWIEWRRAITDISEIGTWRKDFSNIEPQFNFVPDQAPSDLSKRVYMLLNDAWLTQGDQASQSNCNNALFSMLYLGTTTTGFGSIGTNVVAVKSHNNMSKGENSLQSVIDNFTLANNSVTIKLSDAKEKRYQAIKIDGDDEISAFGLKGDFVFDITKSEWTNGTRVPLELAQVKKEDLEESQRDTYKNNLFAINWKDGKSPKAGDVVKLTFNIDCVHTLRHTQNLELTITFAE